MNHALVFIRSGKRILMRQNQPGQWWEGLWDFPRLQTTVRFKKTRVEKGKGSRHWLTSQAREQIQSEFRSGLDVELEVGEPCFGTGHGVTKYRIRVVCFLADLHGPAEALPDPFKWIPLSKLATAVPLTSTAKRLVESTPWQR